MKPTIEVRIKADGTVVIKPKGYKGKSCMKATEFLEKDLGLEVTKRTMTPEYHEVEINGQQKQTT
jgi:Protein of unknown function (DUF2997)